MSLVKWGMVSVGKRLKESRQALGLMQAELADMCGITREQQGRFERDVNLPGGDYLLKLAAQGVDVLYILTGARAALSTEEAALLDNYREADDAGKKRIRQASIAQPEPVVKQARRGRGGAAA